MEKKDILECFICKRKFPEFDQRGFRNSGFTSHKKRCQARQDVIVSPKAPKRRRILLPALEPKNFYCMNYSENIQQPSDLLLSNPMDQKELLILPCINCGFENGLHDHSCHFFYSK